MLLSLSTRCSAATPLPPSWSCSLLLVSMPPSTMLCPGPCAGFSPYSEPPILCLGWGYSCLVWLCFWCRSETRVPVGMIVGSRIDEMATMDPTLLELVSLLPQPPKWGEHSLNGFTEKHTKRFFKKKKKKNPFHPAILFFSSKQNKKPKAKTKDRHLHPVFIAVTPDGWIEKWHGMGMCAQTVLFLVLEEWWNSAVCYMDEPWKHYAKWSKLHIKGRFCMVYLTWCT